MTQTNFDSPHGLMNIQNVSTAHDMAKLTCKAMLIPLFKKVVGTKQYSCNPLNSNMEVYNWTNTNRLLSMKGFSGAKTGVTDAAGPCLAAYYKSANHIFAIVICHSKSMDARWDEVQLLV